MLICVVDKGCGGLDNVTIWGKKADGGVRIIVLALLLTIYRTFLTVGCSSSFLFLKFFSFLLLLSYLLP